MALPQGAIPAAIRNAAITTLPGAGVRFGGSGLTAMEITIATTDTNTEPELEITPGQLPLDATLEALDAWAEHPQEATGSALQAALDLLLEAHGVTAATIWIDAPRLPLVRFDVGSGAPGPGTGAEIERPLEAGGRVFGRIRMRGTTDPAGDLVQALGLALDATASRTELRNSALRLAAFDAAVRGISDLVSMERVLQLIVDKVRSLVGARYAALGIVDDQGVIEQFITSGISRAARERIGDLPRGHGLLGLIIRENRSFRIPDIAANEHSSGFPPHHPPMGSFLGVPVTVKGRSVGNLYLTDKLDRDEFSEDDQRVVETFSLHAGIAIENARLHEAVSRLAVFGERERIGKDLHDGIIQSLYAVGLSLEDVPDLMTENAAEATRRVDRAIDAINITIRDIRNFIFGLRPTLLDEADLPSGLVMLAEEVRVNTTLEVDVRIEGAIPALTDARAQEVLSVAREALSNVIRHARASRVAVLLRSEGRALELAIEDDGVGFDPLVVLDGDHQGLRNMRARADALGGALELDSKPGLGTRLVARIPVHAEVGHV
jgi:signal transduction histidine kinase